MEKDKFKKELIIYIVIVIIAILAYFCYSYFSTRHFVSIVEEPSEEIDAGIENLLKDFTASVSEEQINEEALNNFTAPDQDLEDMNSPVSKEILKDFNAPL